MSRGKRKDKKKPAKSSGFWMETLIGALVDFFVGLALMFISKILK